jgi:hypothetical protein
MVTPRLRTSNPDIIPSSFGIPPVGLFISRCSTSSFWNLERLRSIRPVNLFDDRYRRLNLGKISGSELGIGPEKLLPDFF